MTLGESVVVTTLKLPVPGLVVIVPSTLTSVVLTSHPEVKALGFSTGVSACLLGLIGEVCSPGSSELHFIWQNDRLTAVSSFIFVEFVGFILSLRETVVWLAGVQGIVIGLTDV